MLFIINPVAARGHTLGEWERARCELERRHISFTSCQTVGPGEATEITRRALLAGNECIVAVGGDGTLNEIVNGWFDEVGRVIAPHAVLGLWPSGTGSDFRRSVGLLTRNEALAALVTRRISVVDVIRVELQSKEGARLAQHAINVISFGLGGDTAALVNAWRATWPGWVSGHARFVVAALLALKNYRPVPVRVRLAEGRESEIRSGFLVVANGRYAGGGMLLAPQADLNDGLLDLVLTDGATRWDVVKELPRIRSGAYLRNPKVSLARSRQVEIMSESPLAVEIDGEFAGYTPARMTLLPAAIRFLVAAGAGRHR